MSNLKCRSTSLLILVRKGHMRVPQTYEGPVASAQKRKRDDYLFSCGRYFFYCCYLYYYDTYYCYCYSSATFLIVLHNCTATTGTTVFTSTATAITEAATATTTATTPILYNVNMLDMFDTFDMCVLFLM